MKKLLVLVVSVLLIGLSQNAYALINGGFETGDLTGWTVYIPPGATASVATSHSGDQGTTYNPIEGSYFAKLRTDGPYSYTSLKRNFSISSGLWIEGWAAFDARDYTPYNDKAMVRILDNSGNPIVTPWYSDVLTLGDYGDGPWTYWSWIAPSSGTYTVEYRVANWGDDMLDSYALFDATNVIPEPASLSLLGLGILGLLGIKGKRKKV